jgi:hypothetical protein
VDIYQNKTNHLQIAQKKREDQRPILGKVFLKENLGMSALIFIAGLNLTAELPFNDNSKLVLDNTAQARMKSGKVLFYFENENGAYLK